MWGSGVGEGWGHEWKGLDGEGVRDMEENYETHEIGNLLPA